MKRANQPRRQLTIPRPNGLEVAHNEAHNELIITRRWRSGEHLISIVVGLLVIGIFIYLQLSSSGQCALGLFSWVTIFALIIFIHSLLNFINQTTIRLNHERLTIEHGPIPYPNPEQFKAAVIRQLYVSRVRHKSKDNARYTYDLYAVTKDDARRKLLTGLGQPGQALYLETTLEQFLDLPDRPVAGEWGFKSALRGWINVADTFHLDVVMRADTLQMQGSCRGRQLRLEINAIYQQPTSRLTVAIDRPGNKSSSSENTALPPLTPPDLDQLLNHNHFVSNLRGSLYFDEGTRHLIYQTEEQETERSLILLIDGCCYLLDVDPLVMAGGGEFIPILEKVVAHENHPLRFVAWRWLEAIASTTKRRFRRRTDQFLCPECLTGLGPRQIKHGSLEPLTYYGCRMCGQSQPLLETAGQAEVILDDRLAGEQRWEQDVFQVNWLIRRELFDFDRVKIAAADDEAVERFAVQVGNDTDPLRRPRYPQMRCVISPDCRLSENTRRILQRIFGQVV